MNESSVVERLREFLTEPSHYRIDPALVADAIAEIERLQSCYQMAKYEVINLHSKLLAYTEAETVAWVSDDIFGRPNFITDKRKHDEWVKAGLDVAELIVRPTAASEEEA